MNAPTGARSNETWGRSGPSWAGSVITFDPDALSARITELEEAMGAPGFWDDQQRGGKISSEHARLTRRRERYETLASEADDLNQLLELASTTRRARRDRGRRPGPARGLGAKTRSSRASTTPATPLCRSTAGRAERMRRTGPRCCCGCTSAGPSRGLETDCSRRHPGGGRSEVGGVHRLGATTPTACCGPSGACTGSCASPRSIRHTGAHVVRAGDRQPVARR